MKTLNASQLFPGEASSSRFESAKDIANSLAESDNELLEPEIVAWIDRTADVTCFDVPLSIAIPLPLAASAAFVYP